MNGEDAHWHQNREAHDEFERQLLDVQSRQRADRVHLDELDSATRETHTALLKHLLDELRMVREELARNTADTRELKLIAERGKVGFKVIVWLLAGAASLVTGAVWLIEKWQTHMMGRSP
jgi:hypothetical protein